MLRGFSCGGGGVPRFFGVDVPGDAHALGFLSWARRVELDFLSNMMGFCGFVEFSSSIRWLPVIQHVSHLGCPSVRVLLMCFSGFFDFLARSCGCEAKDLGEASLREMLDRRRTQLFLHQS